MTKILTKIKPIARWLALTLIRASIVILGYALYLASVLIEYALILTAHFGKLFDVTIHLGETEEEGIDFTQKFDSDDIASMANKVSGDATIKQIESELGISYRQARKVREAAKNSPTINRVYWDAQFADNRV